MVEQRFPKPQVRGSNPLSPEDRINAGKGNRTLILCLEGR